MRYGALKGIVIDSTTRYPIEAATISVFSVADSSLFNYGFTNKKGEFLIKVLPLSIPCRVLISYSGFRSFTQDFTLPADTREFSLPVIQLKKTYAELEEVIVTARRPPVLFKNDTIEFDAGSFKTAPNGLLEDLLKILPGLEVDDQGNITVNGKKVSKITVDGKDFFGGDFRIPSRNLPRDIIDKVQVIDYKPFEARFNKTIIGNEDKVINLTLKKDSKKGIFGRLGVGYGSDQRYEASASLNYMKGALQLNGIGNLNNVNRGGTSGADFAVGKLDGSMEAGERGILATKAGGLNFGNEFGKRLKVNGSYFYNHSNTINVATIRRQNILPGTFFFYNSTHQSMVVNNVHRANLEVIYHADSATMIVAKVLYNGTRGKSATANNGTTTNENRELMNTATNRFVGRPGNNNLQWEFFIGRQLKKEGRAFTLRMNYTDANNSALDSNKGSTVFYQPGGGQFDEGLDQESRLSEANKEFNISAAFTEPVSKTVNMALGYNYSKTNGWSDKTTLRFNPSTGYYDIVDTPYTNALGNRLNVHVPNWAIAWNTSRFNASLGLSVQWLEQVNKSQRPKNVLKQSFANLFPAARIDYRFSKTGNLNLSYTARSQQPTMEQLQPVADNSNMVYIKLGNPNLKPTFLHIFDFNIQEQKSKGFWAAGLALNLVQNQIVEDTWFDSVQVTRAVNSNGNYSVSFHSGFNHNWRARNWSLRWSAFNNGSYHRNQSFANKVAIIIHTFSFTQRTTLTYTFKDLVTLMPYFTIRYLNNRYGGQEIQRGEFITNTFTVKSLFHWPRRFVLENNVQIVRNNNTDPNFSKTVTLWNAAVNYQLGKNRQATFRLAAFDLLKQNTSINRFIAPTYIEDNQAMILQQYFLLSLIYNLKQMK